MRLLLSVLCLTAFVAIAAPKQVQLVWDASPNATEADVCLILHSTDIAVPMTNWTVFATLDKLATNHVFQVEPGKHFWTIQYTNFWGVSPFSNVASTPEVVNPAQGLTIHRLQ